MKHGETQMKPGEMQFEHTYHTRFARMWLLLPDHIKGWFVIGQVVLEELLIYFTSPSRCYFDTSSVCGHCLCSWSCNW